MQDFKKNKRRMNANQMASLSLSNEEAIDKEVCDDLQRGCKQNFYIPSFYIQNTCFPIVFIIGLVLIHELVAVTGL